MDFDTCLPEFDSHYLPEGSEFCVCKFYHSSEFYFVNNTHNTLGVKPNGIPLVEEEQVPHKPVTITKPTLITSVYTSIEYLVKNVPIFYFIKTQIARFIKWVKSYF